MVFFQILSFGFILALAVSRMLNKPLENQKVGILN